MEFLKLQRVTVLAYKEIIRLGKPSETRSDLTKVPNYVYIVTSHQMNTVANDIFNRTNVRDIPCILVKFHCHKLVLSR